MHNFTHSVVFNLLDGEASILDEEILWTNSTIFVF